MAIGLKAAQLLSSRLCHDLVGPMGAVNAGVELISEEGSAGEGLDESLGLIASSAGEATTRLSFYRMAFGSGGSSGDDAPLKEAQALAGALFAGGRVAVDWEFSAAAAEIPLAGAKLLLGMVLLGAEAVPRGGKVTVTVDAMGAEEGSGYRLEVTAVGNGARIEAATRAAMRPEPDAKTIESLNARTVVAHFAACQAMALGAVLEAETDAPDAPDARCGTDSDADGRVSFRTLVSAP